MHSRNPYHSGVDFSQLAKEYLPLKPHLIQTNAGKATIDFRKEESLRLVLCLTKAIMRVDFGITLELPESRLCPPVPNRLNYILWIQDIVRILQLSKPSAVYGLDIGTGASAIYPILAVKTDPYWKMVGTELDETSQAWAQKNVSKNGLDSHIQLRPAQAQQRILFPLADMSLSFSFSMCNPPFYESEEEVKRSADGKLFAPNAVCTGAPVEMITDGGEAAFVRRMIDESTEFREKCIWYTSMLGKMSSVESVIEKLKEIEIDNYAVTEFKQGQTRRWAVGWSFSELRLPDDVARTSSSSLTRLLPERNKIVQTVQQEPSEQLQQVIDSVEGIAQDGNILRFKRDSWSRAARRRQGTVDAQSSTPTTMRLTAGQVEDKWSVEFHWLQGRDRQLFQSFCSHVSRKLLASNNVQTK